MSVENDDTAATVRKRKREKEKRVDITMIKNRVTRAARSNTGSRTNATHPPSQLKN